VSGSGLIFGLPLLTKDLIEQAAHRRTFVLRVVYAIVLYGSALWIYADVVGGGASGGISSLGRGRELFTMLVNVQMGAIIILLPGISCGAITAEKERDTLGLLLLTQLSPLTIVLEKLVGRLVTMGTYQLLSLPLFALAYGLGGVELFEMITAIWLLAWWSVVVGSLSLYCSAWHRTTAGAFIAAYSMMPLVICFAASCVGMVNPAMREVWHSQASLSWIQFLTAAGGTILLLLVMAMPLLVVSGNNRWPSSHTTGCKSGIAIFTRRRNVSRRRHSVARLRRSRALVDDAEFERLSLRRTDFGEIGLRFQNRFRRNRSTVGRAAANPSLIHNPRPGVREIGRDRHGLARHRVLERQRRGMKSDESVNAQLRAVLSIPGNRPTSRRQLHADLMTASCFREDLQQGQPTHLSKSAVRQHAMLPVLIVLIHDRHNITNSILRQMVLKDAVTGGDNSFDKCHI
jgi:ABC-type transport system involved in multi-copper enzyme maturation permease subunit